MIPRIYYANSKINSTITLNAEKSRHLIQVLRLSTNARVIVFDGEGNAFCATITHASKHTVDLAILDQLPPSPADHIIPIHIGQGLCSNHKMDWTIEKMTELGAMMITPLLTTHSGKRSNNNRLKRLIIAACEQCGRNRLTTLNPEISIKKWIATIDSSSIRLLLSHRATLSLASTIPSFPPKSSYTLAIGPETGFSKEEETALLNEGFKAVHIGARILRTETAACTALSTINALTDRV